MRYLLTVEITASQNFASDHQLQAKAPPNGGALLYPFQKMALDCKSRGISFHLDKSSSSYLSARSLITTIDKTDRPI